MRRIVALLVALFAVAALALTVRAASTAFADNGVIHGNHTSGVLADDGVISSRD
jgi:hypothetical protein